MGAWTGCHQENLVNKLSVLGFEITGKDVFRVPGEHQASSALPGQSLNSLRAAPPGEASKPKMQKIDLSTHPEHHELVLLLIPPPSLLAGPCPVPSCAALVPISGQSLSLRGQGHSQHTQLLGCCASPNLAAGKTQNSECCSYFRTSLLPPQHYVVKAPHKSAAGIQPTSPKTRFPVPTLHSNSSLSCFSVRADI